MSVGEGSQMLVDVCELHAHRVYAQVSCSELLPGGHVAEPVVSGLTGDSEPGFDTDLRRGRPASSA